MADKRSGTKLAVNFSDIEDARARLVGAVARTPCVRSEALSRISGAELYLKLENLQHTGSFKVRGSFVKLSLLSAEQRARGVVAMSAGNHAQGLAYHAQRLGIPAVIVMPTCTPNTKVEGTRQYGARVILHGEGFEEAASHAHDLEEEEGLTFVHPYDDPAIIAGQGTVGLEMLQDVPDLDVLVVPVGGGGLISGVAIAAKHVKPEIEIVGVEVSLYPSVYRLGRDLPPEPGGPTVAEGIAVKSPGRLTIPAIEALVSDVILVSEEEIESAMMRLLESGRIVAEGAGAASLAAVLGQQTRYAGRRVGLVVSGGNVDMRLLSSVIFHGLVRGGRLARIRVAITDQPGILAKVANLIGEGGGNIVEVYHRRAFSNLSAKSAELDVIVETRGSDHVKSIFNGLLAAGFDANLLPSGQGSESG